MYVSDFFKNFQKVTITNAKKSEKDSLITDFSKTELFDIVNVTNEPIEYDIDSHDDNSYIGELPLKFFSLPFENCFVKVSETKGTSKNKVASEYACLFIKEDAPNLLSGIIDFKFVENEKNLFIEKLLFSIMLEDNKSTYYLNKKKYDKIMEKIENIIKGYINKLEVKFKNANDEKINEIKDLYNSEVFKLRENDINYLAYVVINSLVKTQRVFEKLSKCEILVDNAIGNEYYRIKGQATKKVTNRPIYYVLDKETYTKKAYTINPITKLEYSHAFRVRGHWRRINEKSIGKDRTGNYHIEGFTWVIDHMRGEGELVKRARIIKEKSKFATVGQ